MLRERGCITRALYTRLWALGPLNQERNDGRAAVFIPWNLQSVR